MRMVTDVIEMHAGIVPRFQYDLDQRLPTFEKAGSTRGSGNCVKLDAKNRVCRLGNGERPAGRKILAPRLSFFVNYNSDFSKRSAK